ncbi:hypothetical protein niasHS_002958 [Heterodera schachtii]|uniref:Uncharacterized protein n=1 Tax=Heterodera schachtii TaxID=97005 RepID=A0ABD2K9Y3_HETSC
MILIFLILFCALSCHFCAGQPRRYPPVEPKGFPCCPGSQQVATFMSSYIVNFANTVDTDQKEQMCEKAIENVHMIKRELFSLDRCQVGGGARIFDQIDEQLHVTTTFWQINLDACSYAFSFIRAMFMLATKATGHMKSVKWATVTRSFTTQIEMLDQVCHKFNISLNKNVHFSEPYRGNDSHFEAPEPDALFSSPGQHSAYTTERS